MTDLADFADEVYGDNIRLEEQDLRLLKALVSDDNAARQVASAYGSELFVGDAAPFADIAISYFKTYGALPTRRVMVDVSPVHNSTVNHIWDELDKISYNKSEFSYDLDKIQNRFVQQEVYGLRRDLDELDPTHDPEGVLRDIRARIDKAEKVKRGKEAAYTQKTLKSYMSEFKDEFKAKVQNPELGRGIMTGYSYLDYVTNGLQPTDMLIVGAETGGGKSMFLANMAAQIWMQKNTLEDSKVEPGKNVLYFSLEMPFDQCARRTFARLSQISTYALRDAHISKQQAKRLAQVDHFIENYESEFEIVDIPRGVTAENIEERFLESVTKGHRPDVVVVDYLGLMSAPDIQGDDWLKLGEIAGKLHEFARAQNVVVLTAVQLNRPKGKDPNDIIGLHRIGRSSNIMHHASIGIQIETRPDEDTYADLPYHIIKNRNGERGHHILKKQFKYATLVDQDSYRPQHDNIGSFTAVNQFDDLTDTLRDLGW